MFLWNIAGKLAVLQSGVRDTPWHFREKIWWQHENR
jgi:uncharacterized membrane protein